MARDPVRSARPARRSGLRRLWDTPAARVGLLLLTAYALVALAAPLLAPCPPDQARSCGEDPYRIPRDGFASDPRPPGPGHPLGTTARQFDLYYGLVWGTRTAFKVSLLITLPALLIGILVGAAAGFVGGWLDEILMRVVEIFMAFPYFLAAVTLATLLRAEAGLANSPLPAMLALTAFGWMGYARLIRAEVLSVRERDYVWAARALGQGPVGILRRHVLPNTVMPVFVVAMMDIGTTVLSFAALSFFGLGVPDGYADWGQLLSHARNRIPSLSTEWHIVVFPGGAVLLFALAWTLVGDALRDALDPRSVGRGV